MRRRLALAMSACLLAGCAHPPPVPRPELVLPATYRHQCEVESREAARPSLEAWWLGFGDAGITRTVERALAQSPVIAQAAARADQAGAGAQAAGAAGRPQAQLQAGGARVRQSLLDPVPRLGRAIPGFERDFTQRQVGAGAAWDLDLAGGTRAMRAAAEAQAQASLGLLEAARADVAAQSAEAYLGLRALQGRLALAADQEAVQRQLAELVDKRVAQGLSAPRELDSALAALEGLRAAVPPLQASIDTEIARLEVLMGGAPGSYRAELEGAGPVPLAPAVTGAQGPAALMRRRPDILAAEQRLVAASAHIAASVAAYYPQVSLSALIGWSSSVPGRLFEGDAATRQLGLGLRWRLFDFGRVDAEVAAARGHEAEAVAAYRAVVWNAAAEVEGAFSTLLQEGEHARLLQRQRDRLQSAREHTRRAYEQGASSLLEVLDIDRQVLAVRERQLQAQWRTAQATVEAFHALGGGWQAPPPAGPVDDGACLASARPTP